MFSTNGVGEAENEDFVFTLEVVIYKKLKIK